MGTLRSGSMIAPSVDLSIGYSLENIKNLFKDQFLVPGYQRPYDWREPQIRELLTDVVEHMRAYPADRDVSDIPEYILGPALLLDRGSNVKEVIDGQQRLTKLFLIVAGIVHYAKEPPDPAKRLLRPRMIKSLEDMVAVADGHDLTIRIRDENSDPKVQKFINQVAEGRGLAEALGKDHPAYWHQRVLKLIVNWLRVEFPVDENQTGVVDAEHGELDRFVSVLRERVHLAPIVLDSAQVAWQAFERANDRGKPLAVAGKVKAQLFVEAGTDEERKEIGRFWTQMLGHLRSAGPNADKHFLRHIILADVADKKISNSHVKDQVPAMLNTWGGRAPVKGRAVAVARTLADAAKALARIREGCVPADGTPCVPLLDMKDVPSLARFTQAEPVLLAARDLPKEAFTQIAEHVERAAVVLTMTNARGQSYEKELFSIARLVRNGDRADPQRIAEEAAAAVDELLHSAVRSGEPTHLDGFRVALDRANLNSLGAPLMQYLLCRVENELRRVAKDGTRLTVRDLMRDPQTGELVVHIEHIFPQNPSAVEPLAELETDATTAADHVDSLGNLTLWEQSQNSSARDSTYSTGKRVAYCGSRFKMTKATAGGLSGLGSDRQVQQMLSVRPRWTLDALLGRHVELVNILFNLFAPKNQPRKSVSKSETSGGRTDHAELIKRLGVLGTQGVALRCLEALADGAHTLGAVQQHGAWPNPGSTSQGLRTLAQLGIATRDGDGGWDLTDDGEDLVEEYTTEEDRLWAIAERVMRDPLINAVASLDASDNDSVKRAVRLRDWAKKTVGQRAS